MEEVAAAAELGYYEELVVDAEDVVELDYEGVTAELLKDAHLEEVDKGGEGGGRNG